MQRQTSRHNRWTSLSVATMVMLLGGSVGCVSLKHHLGRHSLEVNASHHDDRYYHCPHCGQIIPREGFSKCPRCFQIPVYHGYEPTCWRQWPDGWGCPPESVVNNPEFWAQGMLESDVREEVAVPIAESDTSLRNTEDAANSLPLSGESEVNFVPQQQSEPQRQEDIVHAENSIEPSLTDSFDDVAEQAIAAELTDNVAVQEIAAELTDDVAEQESLDAPAEAVATKRVNDAAEEAQESDAPPQSVVRQEEQSTSRQPDAVPMMEDRAAEPEQIETSTVVQDTAPQSAQTEPPVEELESVIDAATVAPELSSTTPEEFVLPVTEAAQPAVATTLPETSPLVARAAKEANEGSEPEHTPDSVADPSPEIVNRIPVPEQRALLVSEQRDEGVDVSGSTTNEPVLVRTPAPVVEVKNGLAGEPNQIDAVLKPSPRVIPHDEHGPIPVRKVQLATAKPRVTQVTQSAETSTTDEHPSPVNRIALPTPRVAPSDELHPTPVRRVQLSELPVRIRR